MYRQCVVKECRGGPKSERYLTEGEFTYESRYETLEYKIPDRRERSLVYIKRCLQVSALLRLLDPMNDPITNHYGGWQVMALAYAGENENGHAMGQSLACNSYSLPPDARSKYWT